MELINKAINKLETAKRTRRYNHANTNRSPENTKYLSSIAKYINREYTEADDKEKWLKAYEMQQNRANSLRNRRDIEFGNDNFEEILNDFKKARDALYEDYKWKRYNISEIWSKWEESSYDVTNANPAANLNATIPFCEPKNCTMHIGITASVFGALILLLAVLTKLSKKFLA